MVSNLGSACLLCSAFPVAAFDAFHAYFPAYLFYAAEPELEAVAALVATVVMAVCQLLVSLLVQLSLALGPA